MTNMIKMFKSRFDRFCHSMATSESMRITGDCTIISVAVTALISERFTDIQLPEARVIFHGQKPA